MKSRLGVEWARQNRNMITSSRLFSSKTMVHASPQVIGVGALNVNYVLSFNRAQALRKQMGGRIDGGQENWVGDADIEDDIQRIGYECFDYCGLGGAAYHTIDCLAQTEPGLSLGYIGVAGAPVKVKGPDLDILKKLEDRKIDHNYVLSSPKVPGRTVSIRKYKTRTNKTTPGANDELIEYIRSKREEIIEYLAGARWVHLSSLVDRECMSEVAKCVEEARHRNGKLIVSFDPGSEYCRMPNKNGTNIVEQVLACTDYLFVNSDEFNQLFARDKVSKGENESRDVAAEVFRTFKCDNVCIVVQDTNYY